MEANEVGGVGVSDLEIGADQDKFVRSESLVGLRGVAARLAVCTRTVHRLIAQGELPPPVKVGRASRWFVSDVQAYLARLRQGRARFLPLVEHRGAA